MNDIVIRVEAAGEDKKEKFDIADAISTLIQANITLLLMQICYALMNIIQPPQPPSPPPPPTPPTPPELAEIISCDVEIS